MGEIGEMPISSKDKRSSKENLGRDRVVATIRRLQEKDKSTDKEKQFPLVGLLGDTDTIEGHQIDLVQQPDRTVMHFKMTRDHKQAVLDQLQQDSATDRRISAGEYEFQFVNGKIVGLSDCWKIALDDNTIVSVSKNSRTIIDDDEKFGDAVFDEEGKFVKFDPPKPRISTVAVASLDGAVKVDVVGLTDPEQIAEKLQLACNLLQIPEVFTEPTSDAENAYKLARIRWQQKLATDAQYLAYARAFEERSGTPLIDHLVREEVSPEYFTVVDSGASERYQQFQPFHLVHQVFHAKFLPSLVTNGLLASHERYKRGMEYNGRSTDLDFRSGGGDSVFMRMYPANSQQNIFAVSYNILVDPAILNRTDWFSYEKDWFGATEGARFIDRLSPDKFFAYMKNNFKAMNEIMVRRAVPPERVRGITVPSAEMKQQALQEFTTAGIFTLNGRPIEECILVGKNFQEHKITN